MKLYANIAAIAAILLLLAGMLIPTTTGGGPPELNLTRHEMSQAALALHYYEREYGQLPSETDNVMLVQILEGDNPRKLRFYTADRKRSKTGQFLDGWGMPLVFKLNDAGLIIRSAGKDARYLTNDDITEKVQVRSRSSLPSTNEETDRSQFIGHR